MTPGFILALLAMFLLGYVLPGLLQRYYNEQWLRDWEEWRK